MPHPGGRPTKYRPHFCDIVIDLGLKGKSVAQICRELGIHKEAYYNYLRRYPEFSNAHKLAMTFSEAKWTDYAEENLTNPKFGAGTWYGNMKNRFGWRDRQEVDQKITTRKLILVHDQRAIKDANDGREALSYRDKASTQPSI